MSKILAYEEKDTWIHELSGLSKLPLYIPIAPIFFYYSRVKIQ